MIQEAAQTPETVESLTAEVLDLRNKIWRQNIVNQIGNYTPPLSDSGKLNISELPEIAATILISSPEDEEQNMLVIINTGEFGDDRDIFIEHAGENRIEEVLRTVALIKYQQFRRIDHETWGTTHESQTPEDEKFQAFLDASRPWIEEHKLELLKETKGAMEQTLAGMKA